jgi:c-di-GMP-binding flagellar brake protein YcgR
MTVSLTDEEIEERYLLVGHMEIVNILNDLIHRIEQVTVTFDVGRDFIITTLLEVRPDALIFDLGSDDKANRRLEKNADCVFTAAPDGIRVRFTGGQARRFSWGGSDAFWVPLPDRIVRLQHRESYRIQVPASQHLMVSLISQDAIPCEWPVHDLSIGGLGAMILGGEPNIAVNQLVSHLRIMLPNKRLIENNLAVVRHVTPVSSVYGSVTRHLVGVEFDRLPRAMEITIQRYLIDLEHERRRLLGE